VNGEVRWTGADGYVGTTSGGKSFGIFGDSFPSPTEMVIHAHASCSLIDVIDGLKHRIANVEYATVEIEVEMAEEFPKVFTSVNMKYIIKGDVPEVLVRRLIESSHERYCRVGIMITRSGASLDWSLDIRP
tara:strand:- start:112 stop:504 length:393 start_codon:yes stop_codon:yes gene_type:complete